jgi:hypothetical protein
VIEHHQIGLAFSTKPSDFLGLTGAYKKRWIGPISAACDLTNNMGAGRGCQCAELLHIGLRPPVEGQGHYHRSRMSRKINVA